MLFIIRFLWIILKHIGISDLEQIQILMAYILIIYENVNLKLVGDD